jgi:hypothetical protein
LAQARQFTPGASYRRQSTQQRICLYSEEYSASLSAKLRGIFFRVPHGTAARTAALRNDVSKLSSSRHACRQS